MSHVVTTNEYNNSPDAIHKFVVFVEWSMIPICKVCVFWFSGLEIDASM